MRTVVLQVPDGRCVDAWWESVSPEGVAALLEAVGVLVPRDPTTAVEPPRDDLVRLLATQCQHLQDLVTQQRAPQERGAVAEDEIERLLADTLLCEIHDTSHAGGCGDRLVTTPDGLRLMVEVKDVERLHSKKDIEKFRRDVYANAATESINAALLISLRTSAFPNMGPGPCAVYMHEGPNRRVPVLMVSGSSRTAIQLAVRAAAQLQEVCAKEAATQAGVSVETLERERAALQRHVPAMLAYVRDADLHTDSRIETLQRLLEEAVEERGRLKDLAFESLKLQQQVTWLDADDEQAIKLVARWFERKGVFPKTSEMTAAQRNAVKLAGGLRKVVDEVKKRQRTSDSDDGTRAA